MFETPKKRENRLLHLGRDSDGDLTTRNHSDDDEPQYTQSSSHITIHPQSSPPAFNEFNRAWFESRQYLSASSLSDDSLTHEFAITESLSQSSSLSSLTLQCPSLLVRGQRARPQESCPSVSPRVRFCPVVSVAASLSSQSLSSQSLSSQNQSSSHTSSSLVPTSSVWIASSLSEEQPHQADNHTHPNLSHVELAESHIAKPLNSFDSLLHADTVNGALPAAAVVSSKNAAGQPTGHRGPQSPSTALPEIEELNSLRSETLLCRLLELRGHGSNIFLTTREFEKHHVEKIDKYLTQFRRQNVKGFPFIRNMCHGKGSGITMGILGLMLIILGVVVEFCGKGFRELVIDYEAIQSGSRLAFTSYDWNPAAAVLFYFSIQGFVGCFRGTYSSRPKELFPTYKCDTPGTLDDVEAIRPLTTIPEIDQTLPPSSLYFPCGSSSYSFFNDRMSFWTNNGGSQIPLSTKNIAPKYSLINYARMQRPNGLSPSNDWINVTSAAYRNWMTTAAGGSRRLLIGKLLEGLTPGNYFVKYEQNVWPSELWSARKSVALIQLSLIGSSQKILGVIFLGWGLLMATLSILILVSARRKWRWQTQTASAISEERILDTVIAMCTKNKAARDDLFSRLQKRRVENLKRSMSSHG